MADDAKSEEAKRDDILRRLLKTPPQPRKGGADKGGKDSEKDNK